MELEKSVVQAKPVKLSMDDQQEIITFVSDCWQKGKDARKKYKDHWEECAKAYHCEMPPIESPELDWMSNICLPWAYDSAESWYAHIHSTTIPKNDQIFTISGRTEEDHPGAEVMQKYLEYRFERNKFPEQLGKAYRQLVIKNHTCLKVVWREDKTVVYNWVQEPVVQEVIDEVSGMPMQIQTGTKLVRKPQEQTDFNNVWVEVVDIDNFVMYPIHGDIEKTTRIHETYKHYEDLMASAQANENNYFNLNELSLDDERATTNNERREEREDAKRGQKGLNIKEAWIHRIKIGDKVYRNYIATVVNDKVLVRFQPFPAGCPKSPFVWLALRPDGDCLYGYGLNSKGLGILASANKIFNCRIDEMLLKIHPPMKYYEGGGFNPNNVVNRPGALIRMGSIDEVQNNLAPVVQDLSPMQQALVEVQQLKNDFESVTVPAVVKGMIETEREHTATEQNLAQNNSNGKMHIDAYHINEGMIKPALEISYGLIYDRIQYDDTIKEEMQLITQPKDQNGMPMGELPVLPLPHIDIKVVGYQNVIRKQEQLANMGQAMPLLAQSPAGKYIKYDNLGEDVMRLMELDTDRLWQKEDERQQTDQREAEAAQAQQNLLAQESVGKLQLQKEKQDQDFMLKQQQMEMDYQTKQVELEIKKIELAIKQQELELKQQQQEHNEAMGIHGAQMSERQADFNEKQALKENKGDK